ncbi:MAG TPA: ABC transporter permease subunit [Methylomirabilota bacterium]|nr:ABC transporter permease subunit [Methylomirabilota bacterium]
MARPEALDRPWGWAPGTGRRRALARSLTGLGPASVFFLYMGLVLVAPAAYLVWSSVSGEGSRLTLERYRRVLTDPFYLRGFQNSLALSLLTAVEATLAGTLLAATFAYAARLPFRRSLLTLTNVAANLGGVSLAFAFVALLGTNGMVTIILRESAGISLYPRFSLVSLAGLNLVYLYFLLPFAFLVVLPAFRGVRRQWIEAALTLGATRRQFWWHIGLPVLWPSILAVFILTFANAFGTYSTAMALTVGRVNLIPLQIGFLFGESAFDTELADALSVLMIVVTTGCVLAYRSLSRRTARWLR